jgi:4-hydroxybenzoate polyprenyltransferase
VRPKQWVKNLFVFAPLLFAKHLLDADLFLRSLAAFAVFATLAGAVYVLNDLFDVHKDREHPYKRLRPIASGALPIPAARILIVALVAAGGFGAFALGWQFALVAGGYVTMNVAYTLTLKHFAFVDVLCIASGFLLRVVAGSLAIDVDISRWLLVCTFLLALFLALGKRKHEFVTLHQSGREARPVMERYQLQHLNIGLWCAGLLTLASYALYTFDRDTAVRFGTAWLPATIVFIAFGIARFVKLIDLHDAESPTEEMLKDVPFIANGLLWATAVIVLIYTGNT